MRYADGDDFKQNNGYEIDGVWFPRVTRILEVKSKPALENFFWEMGSQEAANAVKEKSAVEGTMVHEAVQKLAVGEEPDVSEQIRPATEAFVLYNKQRGIHFHPEHIERLVWSPKQRYAGTVDALAEVDGKFGVLDIKTSTGFYPEYNLQTAAYIQALQEFDTKRALALPREVETRWILRVDQHKICKLCNSRLREKGGRAKIRRGRSNGNGACQEDKHDWGSTVGEVELKEFPYYYRDINAFNAAQTLWEWENNYWLRQIGYTS